MSLNANAVKVFFYGLFMDESLLAAKGVHPSESAIGYVDGFSLHIGQRATLLPNPNDCAHGVLMTITADEAASLYSGPDVADYVAEPVVVNLPGKVRESAVCYNLPAAQLSGTDRAYAAALLKLATRLGLPERHLERIRHADVSSSTGNAEG